MSGYDEMMKMYAQYVQKNGGGNPPPASAFTPSNPGYDEMMKMYSNYVNKQASSQAQAGTDPMANFQKPLPTGAVGTLPNGQPDYGDGFAGWWKGVQARMAETSFIKLPDGTYTEVAPSALQLTARGLKEGVGGLLAGAGVVQEAAQGALGLTQTLEDVADKSNSFLPDINAGGDAIENSIYAMPGLSVVGGIYNTARILTGERHLSWEEFKKTYDANAAVASGLTGTRLAQKLLSPFENTQAGQAIKNHPWGKGLYDANLRAEYMRRLQTGEKSDAILADLANPLAELGWDFVADPFNLLTMGVGAAAKGKQLEAAQKAFSTIDELKDGWNVLKTADVADAVTREAKLGEMTAVLLTKNTATERALNSTRNIFSPFRMNNRGMQDIATHDLGNFFGGLISTTKSSPDEMGEALRATALLGSKKAEDVKEGLQIYSRLNPKLGEYATSPEGIKASEFLYKMLADEKTGELTGALIQDVVDAAQAKAPVGEILAKWSKVEQAVLHDMYPSVLEMAAQPEKYKVPALALSIAKANEKAQMVVRPINGFFSTAYITMNPGNGGKNLLNNVFTTAIDMGMGAGLDAVTGFVQKIARKEASGIAKIEELLGFVSKSATDGLGHGTGGGAIEGGSNLIGFIKGLVDKGEQSTSIAIVYASVKRTLRKVLKEGVGMANTAEMRNLGIDANAVERLLGLTKQHNGDVAKAIELWMGEANGGVIDTFRDIRSVLNAQDIRAVENNPGLMEAINNVLDAPSKEAAIQRINDIRINSRKLAEKAKAGLIPSVADGDVIGSGVLEALNDGMNVEAGDLFNVKLRVQRDVTESLNDTVDKLFTQTMKGSADPQIRNTAESLYWEMRKAREAITAKQVGLIDKLLADVRMLVKRDPRPGGAMEINALRQLDGFAEYMAHPPRVMDGIKDMVWQFYFDTRKKTWDNILNEYMKNAETYLGDSVKGLGALTGEDLLNGAAMRLVKSNIEDAMKVLQAEKITKDGIFVDGVKVLLNGGNKNAAIRKLAYNELGIATANESAQYGKSSVSADKHLLNLLNKNLPDGEKILSLDDIPFEKAQDIIATVKAEKEAGKIKDMLGNLDTSTLAADNLERIPVPVIGDLMPNGGQAMQANLAGQNALLDRLEAQISQKWGRGKLVEGLTAEQIAAVNKWQAETTGRMAQARAVAARVAQQERDFALLNYSQKTTLDHALAYIMPYQFWYNRSYLNWMKRLATNPDIVSKYAAYREWLDTQHADLPDWWKYNVSINDLPGVNVDNPMYFNLEASLNPLNGITGVDFNDASKMVAEPGTFEYYWTNMLNDVGKFGPSVWTPLSMATSAYYYVNGQKDVASRWGGRLIPQTAPIKAIAANMGIQAEIDPVVILLSGKGLKSFDPYEARRIGRALVTLADQGKYTKEQTIEAARMQSGQAWDDATLLATKTRANGTLMSFFMGVGYKMRSKDDMQIDKFYEDYNAIWQNKDKLSPQEFKVALDNVRFEYPFMDTVLLSKKDGVERDRAYAYSVLGRIAPGEVTAISGGADLSPEIIDKFYSSKGVIDKWQQDDYLKFMGGVVSIGTTLAIPDKTTQQDWTLAKNTYTAMNATLAQQFGADWTDKRDVYYNMTDMTAKNNYLKLHPELSQAMDMQSYLVANNPILAAYYDGMRNISDYYNAQFKREVMSKLGANWYDLLNEKQAIFDDKDRKAFDKAHNMTVLSKQYTALKKQWDALIMQKITEYGKVLPVGQPSQIQQLDPNNLSTGQAGILKALTPKPVVQWETIAPLISASLEDAITRYLQDGRPFTSAEESALGRAALYYKIDVQELLQAANVKFTDSQTP